MTTHHPIYTQLQGNKKIQEITQTRKVSTVPETFTCRAKNSIGTEQATGYVIVGDLDEMLMFTLSGVIRDQEILEGDTIRLECSTIIYSDMRVMSLKKDGKVLTNNTDGIHFERIITTQYSRSEVILWKNITKKDSGKYQCEIHNRKSKALMGIKSITIKVKESKPGRPYIISNFNSSKIKKLIGEELTIDCAARGIPIAPISWYKNGENLMMRKGNELIVKDIEIIIRSANDVGVKFISLKVEHSDKYRCSAENSFGSDKKDFELFVGGN